MTNYLSGEGWKDVASVMAKDPLIGDKEPSSLAAPLTSSCELMVTSQSPSSSSSLNSSRQLHMSLSLVDFFCDSWISSTTASLSRCHLHTIVLSMSPARANKGGIRCLSKVQKKSCRVRQKVADTHFSPELDSPWSPD